VGVEIDWAEQFHLVILLDRATAAAAGEGVTAERPQLSTRRSEGGSTSD